MWFLRSLLELFQSLVKRQERVLFSSGMSHWTIFRVVSVPPFPFLSFLFFYRWDKNSHGHVFRLTWEFMHNSVCVYLTAFPEWLLLTIFSLGQHFVLWLYSKYVTHFFRVERPIKHPLSHRRFSACLTRQVQAWKCIILSLNQSYLCSFNSFLAFQERKG